MADASKTQLYDTILRELEALTDGVTDPIAIMASTVAVVHQAVPKVSWTGFYRVVADELLRVGPYQGPVGCLEIPFDRGVCGAAASELRTQVVEDVHAFPGHIACDAAARSEIVVPVLDPKGPLLAVLDLDSHEPAAFDQDDRRGLERVARLIAPRMASR